MSITAESPKLITLNRTHFVFLVSVFLFVLPAVLWPVFWPGVSWFWYEHVRGPALRSAFGFTAAYQPIETTSGRRYVFAILSLEPAGVLASSGFEVGDIPVGYKHGTGQGFYMDLIAVSKGARREFQVMRMSDYARGISVTRTLKVAPGGTRAGSPSNNPIKQSVRSVTHLAGARCAPARPAAYRVC